MAKHTQILIDIPNPCSQPWDEMTVSGRGRFCTHCQKTVIDFTTWSDAALYSFFAKNNDHICGRFFEMQLSRPISVPYQPQSRLYRLTVALGLTLLLTQTPHLLAQNRPPKIAHLSSPDTKHPKDSVGKPFEAIKGTITDEKKEPLPSAVVQVYHDGVLKGGAATDFDGNYGIFLTEPGVYDLLIRYEGYDSMNAKAIVIEPNKPAVMNFGMTRSKGRDLATFVERAGGVMRRLVDVKEIAARATPVDTINLAPESKKKITWPDEDNPTKRTLTREEINQMPIR